MLYLLLLIRMLFLKYEEFFMGICFCINGIKIKGKNNKKGCYDLFVCSIMMK